MTLIKSQMARAYVNYGRWVADCPTGCGSALALINEDGDLMHVYACIECHALSTVDWPANAEEIWEALQERPYPRVRNWFPASHELALRTGLPHGQTPNDLREEARENGVDNP